MIVPTGVVNGQLARFKNKEDGRIVRAYSTTYPSGNTLVTFWHQKDGKDHGRVFTKSLEWFVVRYEEA